jgi:transcriptional regulator with XRE-family HTH domain
MVAKASESRANRVLHGLRVASGESQQDVADALNELAVGARKSTGVTANQISRWERGTVRPHPIYRRLLAQHFGVSVDDLGLTGEHADQDEPVTPGLTLVSGATVTTGWFRPSRVEEPPRVALCGSRSAATDDAAIDASVAAVSRWLMNHHCKVVHGPRGIGIEVMTYIANHYRPPKLAVAVGVFGHPNVIRDANYVLVLGGGQGTVDEIDLAISMDKKLVPFGATGGAARVALDRLRANVRLREWITQDLFNDLSSCTTAEEFVDLFGRILGIDLRNGVRE